MLRPARRAGAPFPDGVWLVELAALADPALLPAGRGRGAGRARSGRGARWRSARWSAWPAGALLLVLDNCEHLLDACAALAGRAPARPARGLRVLATSREPLRIAGEVAWPVPPLAVPGPGGGRSTPQAAAGLPGGAPVRRAGAGGRARLRADATPTPRAVARLCRRLDGLPLAIELAAARAAC